MLRVEDLSRRYGGVEAVRHAMLSVQEGEILALVGPNGCGKSTLLRLISGAERCASGRVWKGPLDVSDLGEAARVRRGIARLGQEDRSFESCTATEMIQVGMLGRLGSERAQRALSDLNLGHIGASPVRELSFGQRRLVGLVAVLGTGADVILLDEPAAGLAPALIARLAGLLRALASECRLAFLIVEHDLGFLRSVADRCAAMVGGEVVAVGDAGAGLSPSAMARLFSR